MKKSILIAGVAAISMVACKKTETTATDAKTDSVTTTTTAVAVPADSMPISGDSASVATGVKNTVDATAQGAKEVAKDVKDGAVKAADKTADAVNKGAADVKDAANKATDGDGKLTK